jgi:hypothetical protein
MPCAVAGRPVAHLIVVLRVGHELPRLLPLRVDGPPVGLAAALLLTQPYTPMIFQGEEWAASTPWPFFTAQPSRDRPPRAHPTSGSPSRRSPAPGDPGRSPRPIPCARTRPCGRCADAVHGSPDPGRGPAADPAVHAHDLPGRGVGGLDPLPRLLPLRVDGPPVGAAAEGRERPVVEERAGHRLGERAQGGEVLVASSCLHDRGVGPQRRPHGRGHAAQRSGHGRSVARRLAPACTASMRKPSMWKSSCHMRTLSRM